jgi:hypothetical protein
MPRATCDQVSSAHVSTLRFVQCPVLLEVRARAVAVRVVRVLGIPTVRCMHTIMLSWNPYRARSAGSCGGDFQQVCSLQLLPLNDSPSHRQAFQSAPSLRRFSFSVLSSALRTAVTRLSSLATPSRRNEARMHATTPRPASLAALAIAPNGRPRPRRARGRRPPA